MWEIFLHIYHFADYIRPLISPGTTWHKVWLFCLNFKAQPAVYLLLIFVFLIPQNLTYMESLCIHRGSWGYYCLMKYKLLSAQRI